ncbi:MAG: alpha-1,2-fucosyltransferase [Synergistaceae bacterium]|nr:alpha-1,2-fucosyltransferase [Synergistaceae bacterium]
MRLGAWDFEQETRHDRPYYLRQFPGITEHDASFDEIFRISPSTAVINIHGINLPRPLRSITRKMIKLYFRNRDRIYEPSYFSYSPEFLDIEDNTFIDGYWESEKIFADVAGTVRKKLRFPPEYFNSDMAGRISSCNSVAIHIRRGDKSAQDKDGSITAHYLKAATEKISSLMENPVFFVFSDDIEWCRENLTKIHGAEYIFVEGNTPPRDMALMTICKHVIVGTSSFSWWGAWLNANPAKIIIAPDMNLWYTRMGEPYSQPEDRKYLIPESWIKIS